ncbi:MAG: type I-B CRISPR-associated protein Cas7/Cst2/DevR [Candidatus Atribacteria bacterium]|nr:type I-B CRISPR-associated protein Cas7/Cst2/DevR [Candidatus Atribacteria bacterium]
MKTIQGFVLIDVDVAALNNAGGDNSSNLENAIVTKKIKKGGKEYPYVSGQAWRYWWRNTLGTQFNWQMSPIIREKKIAFTEADPMKYPDDDVFGYMRAKKVEEIDDQGNPVLDNKGNAKMKNDTLTRISPLKNSALIGVAYNPIVQNWASMTRQDGDAVPFGIDEYCAVMKGMFSLNIDMVGRFSLINRTGYTNISLGMKKEYCDNGASIADDPLAKNKDGKPLELVSLDDDTRMKRIQDTIYAIKTLSGGAKQTTNMADVTPKLIILASFNSGNHPFSHLAKEERGIAKFSVEALEEIMTDYSDQFIGKIYVGKRKGFMDEIEEGLQKLANEGKIKFGPVNSIIDDFVKTIKLG